MLVNTHKSHAFLLPIKTISTFLALNFLKAVKDVLSGFSEAPMMRVFFIILLPLSFLLGILIA